MASSDSLPILHGANISPYVRKVRVALAYKGLEYGNTQQSPFGASEEFVAKSPLSKIPCWEEGELILPDSSVILNYLDSRYPEPPLLPAARPDWQCSWACHRSERRERVLPLVTSEADALYRLNSLLKLSGVPSYVTEKPEWRAYVELTVQAAACSSMPRTRGAPGRRAASTGGDWIKLYGKLVLIICVQHIRLWGSPSRQHMHGLPR